MRAATGAQLLQVGGGGGANGGDSEDGSGGLACRQELQSLRQRGAIKLPGRACIHVSLCHTTFGDVSLSCTTKLDLHSSSTSPQQPWPVRSRLLSQKSEQSNVCACARPRLQLPLNIEQGVARGVLNEGACVCTGGRVFAFHGQAL